MSAANPNLMETSMVSLLVVANSGGGLLLPCGVSQVYRGVWQMGEDGMGKRQSGGRQGEKKKI
jgi:hypothetical protein